jgi:hypothetical protein
VGLGRWLSSELARLPKLFGLLALYAIPVALINQWLGSNYLFIHWRPKDTPLEIFEKWFGNPAILSRSSR